ncbi:MAG: hypothetical protein ACOYXA_03915 [Bacteroidota bacterium]
MRLKFLHVFWVILAFLLITVKVESASFFDIDFWCAKYVVQKDPATGETKVSKVAGGGLNTGSATSQDAQDLNAIKEKILAIILEDFKEEITAWLRINGKGGEDDPDVLLALALPECFPQDADKLKHINESTIPYFENHKSELQQKIETDQSNKQLFDRIAKSFLGKQVVWSKVSEEDQEATQSAVCKVLVEGTSVTAYVSQLMLQLQHLFNDKNRIIIDNYAATACPELSANLKSEQDKITHVPATLDTRIYVTENSEFNFTTLQAELSRLPENNSVRVFIVIVSNDKVSGLLNKRLTDQNLSSLDKYYSVQRTASAANKCAVAEQLVKDFLKDYGAALNTFYNNLNKQFPNKICNNVNLTLSPNTEVLKEGGLEDYGGLPSAARDEIKNYLAEFSQAYGHSIKTYFTSHSSVAIATTEGSSVFENLKGKFDKGEFDNASYGIWLHYDDNSGCVYIRHGLNENKVFQESKKSKLTKSSDKQQIVAEAKKSIDNVIAELDSKGTQGWNVLASNFRSFWKATVGGVATVYDMGRETYETGQTPVRLWDDTKSDQYGASPFHDPTNGIGSGGGDALVAKALEIPQLVTFGYDIATKEQVRTQLVNTVKEVSWPKIQKAATDYFVQKKDKYAGGGNVMMHEASLDVSSALLELLGGAKILEMLEDLLKKLGKEAREAVVKAIKEKLTDPDQITRFIKDIDGSDKLLDAVAKKTDLIDSWKKLDDAGLTKLTKNVDAVKYVDDLKTPKFGFCS